MIKLARFHQLLILVFIYFSISFITIFLHSSYSLLTFEISTLQFLFFSFEDVDVPGWFSSSVLPFIFFFSSSILLEPLTGPPVASYFFFANIPLAFSHSIIFLHLFFHMVS